MFEYIPFITLEKTMRPALVLISSLAITLTSVANANTEAYYNPANKASTSGLTTGYDLYGTIGCPGMGLLDPSCKAEPVQAVIAPAPVVAPTPAPVVVEAPAPVVAPAPTPVVVEAPAPVVVAAPAPVVVQEKAPASVVSQAGIYGPYVNPMSYCPFPKQ
jgi:hypothetical protein